MAKTKLLLLILVCLLLTGCSDSESFWVGAFMETWLTSNGIATELGGEVNLEKLVGNLLDKAVDEITNGEETTALDFIENNFRDIDKADQIMEEAMDQNDPTKLAEAQALRPEDVTYVEAEVATWVTAGNNAAAESAITKADNVTVNAVMKGSSCRSTRLNQLRIRRQSLVTQLDSSVSLTKEGVRSKLFDMIAAVDGEMNALTTGEYSWFCAQFGQGNP